MSQETINAPSGDGNDEGKTKTMTIDGETINAPSGDGNIVYDDSCFLTGHETINAPSGDGNPQYPGAYTRYQPKQSMPRQGTEINLGNSEKGG